MARNETIIEIASDFLRRLGYPAEVSIEEDKDRLRVAITSSEDVGMLIGKNGETLRALQHILLLVISKKEGLYFSPGSFMFDVNDYQRERENYLIALAKNTAFEVRDTHRSKELTPMPPAERRIIHLTLSGERGVETESVGERS